MFDPFGDYSSAGYLRNHDREKNLAIVKIAEHELFRAQLPTALEYLASRKRIAYSDFLEVHRILFEGLYPWAGKDRAEVLPDKAVKKGSLYFCHPQSCQRAVSEALSIAQDKKQMAIRPGFVMGMFAYAHPFLDGNGRTMLLVHAELCFRAKISVNWLLTNKQSYLDALTAEIEAPNDGQLDAYLQPFIEEPIPRENWLKSVASLPGLDGVNAPADAAAGYSDPAIAEAYRDFENRRGYQFDN